MVTPRIGSSALATTPRTRGTDQSLVYPARNDEERRQDEIVECKGVVAELLPFVGGKSVDIEVALAVDPDGRGRAHHTALGGLDELRSVEEGRMAVPASVALMDPP